MKKALAVVLLLLSGCAEQVARDTGNYHAHQADQMCVKAGLQEGTPEFSSCMVRMMETLAGPRR